MSDTPAPAPRPVALITTLFLFAVVAIGFLVVKTFYTPTVASPFNQTADNLVILDPKTKQPTDVAWKATPTTRQKALADLKAKQAKQATSYAWIDEKGGVVQLPIERAMQLTAEQYGSKK